MSAPAARNPNGRLEFRERPLTKNIHAQLNRLEFRERLVPRGFQRGSGNATFHCSGEFSALWVLESRERSGCSEPKLATGIS